MSRLTNPARIQLWLERLNRQADSTLTVAEFCAGEEISMPSFYQWKRRLSPRVESASTRRQSRQPQPALGSPTIAKQSSFTELVLNAPLAASDSLPSVSLPGGITISLGTQAEMACLIIDRLLQHAAKHPVNKGASC